MLKNRIIRVVLALTIALSLYAYVITFVSAEREETFYDIPVSYQGEALLNDRNLMVTSETKPTVSLTLYGKRSDLRKLNMTNITILTDLSKIGEPGTHSLSPTIIYPGDVPDNAFSVMSQYPTMVKVTVERRVTKNVPVEIRFSGRVPENYIADKQNLELDRQSVSVSGPASAVDQITKALVEVNLDNRMASFSESYRYTLCDASNKPVDSKLVETDAAEVSMTLFIYRVLEVPLSVTVIDGGGATEATSDITIDPPMIQVSGSEPLLEQIAQGLVLGEVDLSELRSDTVLKFPISLPEGLENLSGRTEAQVNVKFPELDVRTIIVSSSQFEALNVPEGLEAVFITSEIAITVRGPKALVAKMNASNILISVDFSNALVGTSTEMANVIMGEGFTAAGAIGNYRIHATIQEVLPEETGEATQ